jgi:O-antigen ligase
VWARNRQRSASPVPWGYANGNATLASLGLVAALLAARGERDVGVRRGWVGIAALLGALAVAAGSTAGIFTLAVALGLLGLTAATRWTGFALIGGPIAVSIALGVTTSLALGSDLGGLRDLAEARGELWAAAAELANEEPLYGIGPGEFAERNPVSTDADLRWAHHGYLQVAAEYGLVGFLLVAALAVWVCVTLWVAAEGAPAAASMAGAAVTIVGLHASVDYVWHLPPILLVTCVLVGAGTSRAPDVGSIAV